MTAAREACQRAITLAEESVSEQADQPDSLCRLGGLLNNIAQRSRDAGQLDEAEGFFRRAIESQRRALAIDPTHERARWFLRNHLMNLAVTEAEAGDQAAALELFRESVAVGDGLVAELPDSLLYRRNLISDLYSVAHFSRALGQFVAAREADERAVEVATRLAADFPGDASNRQVLADLQQQLARDYAMAADTSLRDAQRALTLAQQAVRNNPHDSAAWHTLGLAHCMAGDTEAARPALERSIELTGTEDGINLFTRAMVNWQSGDRQAARRDYAKAVAWLGDERSKAFHALAKPYQAEADRVMKGDQDSSSTDAKRPASAGAPPGQNTTRPNDDEPPAKEETRSKQ